MTVTVTSWFFAGFAVSPVHFPLALSSPLRGAPALAVFSSPALVFLLEVKLPLLATGREENRLTYRQSAL